MRTIRITGIYRLAEDAAKSYERMRAAKLPAGGINSAWRDIEGQRRLFLSRYVKSRSRYFDRGPYGDVRRYQGVWYKRMRGYPVSVPGTSKHNQGLAIDTTVGRPVYVWLKANGRTHGWSRPLIRRDPVHWEYSARKDKAKRAVPKVVPKAPPATPVRRRLIKPGAHTVTASVLRGRSAPSHSARIVARKRRGAVVTIERWINGDGRTWGQTADGVFYAREFLSKRP